MINKTRLEENFIELCKIHGEGRKESAVAKVLISFFEKLGYPVEVDEAHKNFGGEQGNLIIRIPGELKGPTIMLSAHLDTVKTGGQVVPVKNGEYIESAGDTILGADDRAGIASICEIVELLKENKTAHYPLLLMLTVSEEIGLLGARYCNLTSDDASFGVILDTTGPIGKIVNSAPFHDAWKIEIKGKASHAGISPEAGLNSISVASQLIPLLPTGRIDSESTANVARIKGGSANNIVPDLVTIYGECRSRSEKKIEVLATKIRESALEIAKKSGAEIVVDIEREYNGYTLDENSELITTLKKAAVATGKEPAVMGTGGGSDANYFNKKGIPSAVISCGMDRVHSSDERIKIVDLFDVTEMVLNLVTGA